MTALDILRYNADVISAVRLGMVADMLEATHVPLDMRDVKRDIVADIKALEMAMRERTEGDGDA